ncbi:MAG: sugar ABC transporter permease [Anaerolineae bacterium]|nr:sugar ABC transporter permease [Anaerolineae bacterium]
MAATRTISRRRRILMQNLTAYAFLLPAGLLIFTFGLFPVTFAFFVSLHRWRRFPDEYAGLTNYHQAMGDFAFVLFFWAAAAALILGGVLLWRVLRQTLSTERSGILYLLPGAINALAALLFVRWFALLLPVVLDVPRRLRGQAQTENLFVRELFASFQFPEVADAASLMMLGLLAALVISFGISRLLRSQDNSLLWRATGGTLALGVGALVMQLTLETINLAVETARAEGTELPIWSQIILISLGVALLVGAFIVWNRAVNALGERNFLITGLAAILLALGGYLLIAELPRILVSADANMLSGFSVTIMYAAIAVPIQLAIGLGLAYLLYQNIQGKTLFRMIFFLPYIMPFIATSIVFTLLFSHRQDSIINHIVGFFGVPPQKWLLEPVGVGRLIFGPETPQALSGPSLALVVVIIYSIWTYSGYATVVFLAGLGNIPGELYEAARIDGASGWQVFRRLTLPLLSPTTFFLSLVAIIGTFQAFTQLWIMRTPAVGRTMDTVSIYIFKQITDASPNYGYGSALAFVLFAVILLLTILQNRFAGRRVFYG